MFGFFIFQVFGRSLVQWFGFFLSNVQKLIEKNKTPV